jgi:hypothetical protein
MKYMYQQRRRFETQKSNYGACVICGFTIELWILFDYEVGMKKE